jgi:hypothetical protein
LYSNTFKLFLGLKLLKFFNDLGKKMGGYGSGRYGFLGLTPKQTVEQCLELSISKVRPSLTTKAQQVRVKFCGKVYELSVSWTDCHYGGQRPWFLCPCCSTRVGKLYQRTLRGTLACRRCQQLTYVSCQVCEREQLNLENVKLRQKLGARDDDLSGLAPFPERPKGMHQRTYDRICHQLEANELKYQSFLNRRMLKLCQRLAGEPNVTEVKVNGIGLNQLKEQHDALDRELKSLMKEFDL